MLEATEKHCLIRQSTLHRLTFLKESTWHCGAVKNDEYIDWVRSEVRPIQYDRELDVFQKNWPPDSNPRLSNQSDDEEADDVGRNDVVIMAQTSPDR